MTIEADVSFNQHPKSTKPAGSKSTLATLPKYSGRKRTRSGLGEMRRTSSQGGAGSLESLGRSEQSVSTSVESENRRELTRRRREEAIFSVPIRAARCRPCSTVGSTPLDDAGQARDRRGAAGGQRGQSFPPQVTVTALSQEGAWVRAQVQVQVQVQVQQRTAGRRAVVRWCSFGCSGATTLGRISLAGFGRARGGGDGTRTTVGGAEARYQWRAVGVEAAGPGASR
jgi:hypothetical protein